MVRDQKGFTLTELMVVVGIIGILAAISIPAYVGQQKRAARAEAYTNLENLRLLEEQYYAEHGSYSLASDGTADGTREYKGTHGDASDNGIEDILKGFKPGVFTDLNFTYVVTTSNGGQEFTATATGKTGRRTDGDVFTIDQDNIKNF
jgi:type IV pilus assembly protein PilE